MIIFLNNKCGFKMDMEGLVELGLKVENILKKMFLLDFECNLYIYNCWVVGYILEK